MKKIVAGLVVALPVLASGQAIGADKELIISSWAAPVHTMNKDIFPWMISEMEKCSGGSVLTTTS